MTAPPATRRYGLALARVGALLACVGISLYVYSIRDQAQALAGRCAARMARSTSCAHCGIGVPGPKMPLAPAW